MARQRDSEAEPLLAETLKIRERVLGPDHPDTLASRTYLALSLLGKSVPDIPEAVRLIDTDLEASARRLKSELGQQPHAVFNPVTVSMKLIHFGRQTRRKS
jgi:hypothetical protein